MKSADIVREVTMFALRRKRVCFDGWKPEIVFRYFAFHLLAGTLFLAREGRALLGVGVAYPCHEHFLRENEGKPFSWTLPEQGNTLFIGEVITAKRKAIPALLRQAMAKWPWVSTIMTYRRKKLVELHMSQLERLAGLEAA